MTLPPARPRSPTGFPRFAALLLATAALLWPRPHGLALAREGPGSLSPLAVAAARAGLRTEVFERALKARARVLADGATVRDRLAVIDYSLPSRVPRLWVLDLAGGRILARELVAHGRGTGDDLARNSSNQPGSLQSSLGTFLTGGTYRGTHGISLRLRGLDPGVNDQAELRGIVMHGAGYVSRAVVERLGRLGRSQGCPALSPEAARRVIGLIRGGTVLFVYYPSPVVDRTLGL